jgi:Tol biopolymer transport system component
LHSVASCCRDDLLRPQQPRGQRPVFGPERRLRRLTTSARIVERTLEWSPDGAKILFSRVGPPGGFLLENEELFLMNPDGSGITRLTDNGVQDFQGVLAA